MAEKAYLAQKEQYLQDKLRYKDDPEHLKILDEQLANLERSWKVTDATLWFNISAAILLMTGFPAALILSSSAAVAVPAAFFVCALAVAMYLSADAYGAVKQKSLILQEKRDKGMDVKQAELELKQARTHFAITMAKNAIIPTVIMAVYAVSWPAALLLTLAYLGYEIGKGYLPEKQPKQSPKVESGYFLAYNSANEGGVSSTDTSSEALEPVSSLSVG